MLVRVFQLRQQRRQPKLFLQLQHEFVKACNRDALSEVFGDDLVHPGVDVTARAVAPKNTACNGRNAIEEAHKTAVIAPVADNDRGKAGKDAA